MKLLLSPDSDGSVVAEPSSSSAGAVRTESTEHDASRSSSPQDGIEDSSPPGDGVEPVKSPANERLEKFLTGNKPDGEDSPSSPKTDDEESQEAVSAQDEPNGAAAKPKPADALSQQQEQVFNKAFSERPEWSDAIKIARKAGPDAEKEMRKALRSIFQRETAVVSQVEKLKPAAQLTDRIKRCTGDEGLENSVRLIEGWYEGRPEARKMLQELLADLDARTGAVLTSPDLTKRLETAQQQVSDGLMDEAQFEQLKTDLLERERERAEKKSLETKVQSTQQQTEAKRQETMIADRTTALDAWEKGVSARDPDYARIQGMVTDRAARLAEKKHAEAGRWLSPSEMTAVCDEAYRSVKAELGGMLPKPRRHSPPPEGDGSSGHLSEQEPKDPAKALLWRRQRARG